MSHSQMKRTGLTRRQLLRCGALAGAGYLLSKGSPLGAAQMGSSLDRPPVLGVQLYSFRNQMKQDVRGTLRKVKAMGFTDVEAAGYQWQSAAEFRALLDEAGLRCVSFFADYNKLRDDPGSIIKDARTLGARYVIIGWIPHGKVFTAEDGARAAAHFNEWGTKLAAENLRFAYHIHGYEFQPVAGGGTLFDKLMAETKPEVVTLEMDVYWVVHPGQDPVKLLNRYAGRFELMHLKDMRKGVKGDLTGRSDVENDVTIGTGQIDFIPIVQTARKTGVKYMFIEDESSRSLEQVPESFKFIRNIR